MSIKYWLQIKGKRVNQIQRPDMSAQGKLPKDATSGLSKEMNH
ncbi:hypothetical protein SMITH_151 [Smithella sp. ME-1]|uniref:Uncharacterized protein n=1 Tax=hydrocarbon metagenome TaxID=938273 RepID=A0A0W8FTK0_9ZZZZ|nr:hypothetical protein SMITH_151 [Smithella sp. ME-1]